MLEESNYAQDCAYLLSLPAGTSRPGAATEIAIRVDDGADVVVDVGSLTNGRIQAYLTIDQAEELSAALIEILRLPSDRTAGIDEADGVPRLR